MEALFFMWRQMVMEMRSPPPMLVCRTRRGSPMAPSVSRALARRWMGSRRKFSAVERIFPARLAVSIRRVQPRTVTARGFSHKTCSPASRQATPTVW